jgi:hypothetical protein
MFPHIASKVVKGKIVQKGQGKVQTKRNGKNDNMKGPLFNLSLSRL